jgi:hypothetical protein
MCGGAPKPPKAQPNYELVREAAATRDSQSRQRAELKRMRLEDRIGSLGNRFGRASLFSGSQGGSGYGGAPTRTMFDQA